MPLCEDTELTREQGQGPAPGLSPQQSVSRGLVPGLCPHGCGPCALAGCSASLSPSAQTAPCLPHKLLWACAVSSVPMSAARPWVETVRLSKGVGATASRPSDSALAHVEGGGSGVRQEPCLLPDRLNASLCWDHRDKAPQARGLCSRRLEVQARGMGGLAPLSLSPPWVLTWLSSWPCRWPNSLFSQGHQSYWTRGPPSDLILP